MIAERTYGTIDEKFVSQFESEGRIDDTMKSKYIVLSIAAVIFCFAVTIGKYK